MPPRRTTRKKSSDVLPENTKQEAASKKKTESGRKKKKTASPVKQEESLIENEESPEDKLLVRMKNILDTVQKGFTHQSKTIEKMWELKGKCGDDDLFFDHFWYCLRHACLVMEREPPTERIIQFCCKFAVRADLDRESFANDEIQETGPFAITLFQKSLQYHDAHNKAVRFRLCQIVNILLTSLGGDAEIDEELYEKIYSCMLDRMKDKVPGVRVQAVNTLNRLQNPADPECPIMNGYLAIMKSDGVAEVRRAALKAIGVSSKSLLPIIERTKDVNPAVRKAAFEVLAEKLSIRSMKIAYRMQVLQTGLNDRNSAVKAACGLLIKKWLLYYDNDVIKLLKALDVEGKGDLCKDVVSEILQQSHIELAAKCLLEKLENKVIPQDILTCETVFYWGSLTAKCVTDHPDIYDQMMPTLTNFSDYLKTYIVEAGSIEADNYDASYQASYVFVELIKMAKLADFSDEAGRKKLISVIRYIISEAEITVQAVERLVELYCLSESSEQARIQFIAEIINDLRNPLEGPTQFDVKNIESCEKDDPVTMIRCLTMVSGLIQGVQCDVAFDPTLFSLLEDVIMTGVIADHEIVRHLAIKALGLSCILSKTLAKKYLVFFFQVVMIDSFAEILETTLKIIFDLFLVFGFETFYEKDEPKEKSGEGSEDNTLIEDKDVTVEGEGKEDKEDKSNSMIAKDEQEFVEHIIEKFKGFLDDEVLRTVSAEGIAKLMYNGRLKDPLLFSHLLLLWYNPTTEGDPLRHCLGMFFSTYGGEREESLEVIEKAFFPTIQTIVNAPHTSPLQEVNPNNVADLLLSLMRGKREEEIAITMCNEILLNPRSNYGRCLIRTLHHCNIVPGEVSNLKLIHNLLQEILEEVDHPSTRKALKTLSDKLTAYIGPEEEEEKEDDKENISVSSNVSRQSSQTSVKATKKALFVAPQKPLDFLDIIDCEDT